VNRSNLLIAAAVALTTPVMALAQVTGPSSSATPYIVPLATGVQSVSIMTVGDTVGGYRMVGIPDGLGGYGNGGSSFTLLMNHELGANVTAGVVNPVGFVRAHGAAGAFVSRWTIDNSTLQVSQVQDFLPSNTSVFLSNNTPGTTVHSGFLAGGTTTLARLCSGDMAPASAYYFDPTPLSPNSGDEVGTDARIFQSGEESSGVATSASQGTLTTEAGSTVHYGRQMAFIATDDSNIAGDQSRTAYELPHAGLFAWENNLASPLAQSKTVVMGMDDGSPIGQLYVWVGDKQATGNVVERAGLTRKTTADNLYVVRVPSLATFDGSGDPIENRTAPVSGTFTLENEADVSATTFAGLESASDNLDAAQFLRPEDGHWDPINPNRFWFVTTDRYDEFKDNTDGLGNEADGTNDTVVDQHARSRLYHMDFTSISNPAAGGTITAALDGTEGDNGGFGPNMLDNITTVAGTDGVTRLLLQEDVGNQNHNGKIWLYDPSLDSLTLIAQHDPARFGDIGLAATGPFNLDEESSGIIDARNLITRPGVGGVPGLGWFLLDVQAHYSIPGELVEGGQLVALFIPQAIPEPTTAGLLAAGLPLLARRRRQM